MAIQKTGIAGYRYATTACRHCGDSVSKHTLGRHETICAKLPDVARRELAQKRQYSRQIRDKLGSWPKYKRRREIHVNAEQLNSKIDAKRIQLTVSVDLETVRRLLLELAPSFSLDKVTIS